MKTPVRSAFIKRTMAMLLVVMMILTTAVSAFAVDGGALGGDITAGGGDALISEGIPDNDEDSGSLESILDNIQDDPEDREFQENEDPASEADEAGDSPDASTETEVQEDSSSNWLQAYVAAVIAKGMPEAARNGMMRVARAGSGDLTYHLLKWPAGEAGWLVFDTTPPAFLGGGDGLPRITYKGKTAFCGHFNGNPPGGSYTSAEGNDPVIRQILANFDNSDQSDEAYAAAQIAIWAHQFGRDPSRWGGCPGKSMYNEMKNGGADASDLKYNYLYWTGGAQDLITYDNDETPGDDDTTVTPGDDDSSTGDEDATGQVTITKKDDEGRALDGAIFKIDIVFSNGSTGGQPRFEVKDGQRTYYYKHPKGDTGPARVTVTEVQAPPNYVLDPTPQTVTINPTYAKDGGGAGGGGAGGGGAGGAGGGGASLVIGDRPELTFVNADEECSLKIIKYEKGNREVVLSGAQFHVEYADPTVCSDKWDLVTDENGEINISLKKPGTLVVTETQAPANYKIIEKDNNRVIVIQRGDHAVMEVPNDKHGSLIIRKRDTDDHRLLAGAVFEIKKIGGDGSHVGETGGYTKQVTIPEQGWIEVQGLEPGSYQVTEISPPPFYSLSDDPVKTVEVLKGSHEPAEVEFFNDAFTGIRIIKVDAKTGKGLSGAVFSIYEGDSLHDGRPTGKLIKNVITDMNGTAWIGKLERGKYTVVEEQAPDGYVLDEMPWRIVEVSEFNIHDRIRYSPLKMS